METEYQNVSCYSQDYDEDSRGNRPDGFITTDIETRDFGDGTRPWQKFHTAEENEITSKV